MERTTTKRLLFALIDALTVSRLFFGLLIALVSVFFNEPHLDLVVWLMLAGWTTDILDGKLARKLGKPKSWIGERDIVFDSMLILGILVYLCINVFLLTWLGVTFSCLLLYVLKPGFDYRARMRVESPLLAFTFIYLIYLNHSQLVLGIVLTWGILNLLYDLDRALELGRKWLEILKEIKLNVLFAPFRVHLAWISLFGSIILFILTLNVLSFLSQVVKQFIWGITVASILRSLWILWFEKKEEKTKEDSD